MILDLFMCECMKNLFPIFIIWKKRTPMTYGVYVCQFNKHLLTNHNKGIVLLIGLRNLAAEKAMKSMFNFRSSKTHWLQKIIQLDRLLRFP